MQGLRITQKRREAIANLIDQKAQRQLIKNMAVSSVAAKVYELICVQDVNKAEGYMNFFVEHFGFGKIWMNQVRDGFIPKGSAVVFIQDLLHIE
jgi:hypothetical protein